MTTHSFRVQTSFAMSDLIVSSRYDVSDDDAIPDDWCQSTVTSDVFCYVRGRSLSIEPKPFHQSWWSISWRILLPLAVNTADQLCTPPEIIAHINNRFGRKQLYLNSIYLARPAGTEIDTYYVCCCRDSYYSLNAQCTCYFNPLTAVGQLICPAHSADVAR